MTLESSPQNQGPNAMQNIGCQKSEQRGGTQHFVATPSELEARWRAPAFTKDILPIVGIGKLDLSTPFHAIMLCPPLPINIVLCPRWSHSHDSTAIGVPNTIGCASFCLPTRITRISRMNRSAASVSSETSVVKTVSHVWFKFFVGPLANDSSRS